MTAGGAGGGTGASGGSNPTGSGGASGGSSGASQGGTSGGGASGGSGGSPVVVEQPPLVTSAAGAYWQVGTLTEVTAGTPTVTVTATEKQQWIGFGGTFNEAGWDALAELTPAERDRAIKLPLQPGGRRELRLGACAARRERLPRSVATRSTIRRTIRQIRPWSTSPSRGTRWR